MLRYDKNAFWDLDHLLDLFELTADVKQHEVWHPEGNVLNHSLQVFQHAMREKDIIPKEDQFSIVLAALLHDVGKIIISRGHEKHSAILIEPFVPHLTTFLVENHMRFWNYQKGEMKRLSKVKRLHNFHLPYLSLVARWDKMGRVKNKNIVYNRDKIIQQLVSLL